MAKSTETFCTPPQDTDTVYSVAFFLMHSQLLHPCCKNHLYHQCPNRNKVELKEFLLMQRIKCIRTLGKTEMNSSCMNNCKPLIKVLCSIKLSNTDHSEIMNGNKYQVKNDLGTNNWEKVTSWQIRIRGGGAPMS